MKFIGKVLDKKGRGKPKKSCLVDLKLPMQIGKNCEVKGATSDKREWLGFQGIVVLVFAGDDFPIDFSL